MIIFSNIKKKIHIKDVSIDVFVWEEKQEIHVGLLRSE